MTAGALWIPVLWLTILMSRPVSFWVGTGDYGLEMSESNYLQRLEQGDPIERVVYLCMLAAGIVVLIRRRIAWRELWASNRWLLLLFLYWALSAAWSEYSFVGVKRWIKDLGNIFMVLIVLSDKTPIGAIRALLVRCVYLTVPLSVVFSKYFRVYGQYESSTGDYLFCGVATEKNALGALAMLSVVFLLWDMCYVWKRVSKVDVVDTWMRLILLAMSGFLISKANSSTALVCSVLGCVIVLYLQPRAARNRMKHLNKVAAAVAVGLIIFYVTPGAIEAFTNSLGEDVTFTGRVPFWADLLDEPINPWLGTGYQSFWMGPRAARFWEIWNFRPNQAHNGYLETYLNGGCFAILLLFGLLTTTAKHLKNGVMAGDSISVLLFSYFTVTISYNWTEAMYNEMSPIWFVFLLGSIQVRRHARHLEEDNGTVDQAAGWQGRGSLRGWAATP